VLAPTEPILVRCDEDRLFQVVDNLVENAVKYSPTDSTVSLHVGAVVRSESPRARPARRAVVEVRDSGPGVPDEDKERIFEKFYQVNPGPRGNGGGVGLGLAICREIIEAHEGRVWVRDNSDRGSVFSFSVPLAAPFYPTSNHAPSS
jgi:signal transduction histidine kinase